MLEKKCMDRSKSSQYHVAIVNCISTQRHFGEQETFGPLLLRYQTELKNGQKNKTRKPGDHAEGRSGPLVIFFPITKSFIFFRFLFSKES